MMLANNQPSNKFVRGPIDMKTAVIQYRLTYRDVTYFITTKIEIPTRSPDLAISMVLKGKHKKRWVNTVKKQLWIAIPS
jgi:hypothetical protein